MSNQENDSSSPNVSLNPLTESFETEIIENKDPYSVIGVTCQRYYNSKTSKEEGTHIPLSVMDDDTQDLESNKTPNKTTDDIIMEAEKEDQKHNWNDDPLGLRLTEEQQESKVGKKDEEAVNTATLKVEETSNKETDAEVEAKIEEISNEEKVAEAEAEAESEAQIKIETKDDRENKGNQPSNQESKDRNDIEDEITVLPTDSVATEKDNSSCMEEQPAPGPLTEVSRDLAKTNDTASPPLESPQLYNTFMLENHETLSNHLYAHYQDYYDTGSSENKEGEEKEKEEGETVLEDFSSGSLKSFNEVGIESQDVTWDAIFHPMSTFQHIQGELEYHNWNSEDEPVTADIVAERLIQTKLCPLDSNNNPHYPSFAKPVQSEAVIPKIAPTPILKPSPVLTIELEDATTTVDSDGSNSGGGDIVTLPNKQTDSTVQEVFFDQDKQKHYFNILQNIRGPSHGTIISFQLAVNTAKKCIKSKSKKSNSSRKKKEEEGRGKLPAIFGKGCIKEKEKLDTVALGEEDDDEEDEEDEEDDVEKNIDAIIAEKQRYWNERRLFWYGFLCPLLWFYGSIHIKSKTRFRSSVNKRWQKRCRLASLYFSVVTSVVALVVVVKMAGNAAIRQTQSDEIRAVIAV